MNSSIPSSFDLYDPPSMSLKLYYVGLLIILSWSTVRIDRPSTGDMPHHLVREVLVLKTGLSGTYQYCSARDQVPFSDNLASNRHNQGSGSSVEENKCDIACEEKIFPDDLGSSERFFPVDSHRAEVLQLGGNSKPWQEPSVKEWLGSDQRSQFLKHVIYLTVYRRLDDGRLSIFLDDLQPVTVKLESNVFESSFNDFGFLQPLFVVDFRKHFLHIFRMECDLYNSLDASVTMDNFDSADNISKWFVDKFSELKATVDFPYDHCRNLDQRIL
ncbi:hypothetical protein F3Y22_tig00109996pilonHSYRG00006 [Hibiscus syriacus]|uniref:Uncharacterized protein n=1 Tax=Hibiscus syriacus TaxID=106335 RepID=A0A6A3BUL4_HIBSY|nr:hypothetical protein F3Y22_tig00109996pilonHSYRG00006 [Hibiscus syriacus]